MIQLLISILGIILTIFFVIGTHESAHFIVARLMGVKVLRFSIGFGKSLLRWHDKSGTEYVIAMIPLGGYVKMLDEGEGSVAKQDLPFAYNQQPFYKKFLIVLAGPMTNILCAFLLYWIIFMMGVDTIKPVIGTIAPNSLAAQAGLNANEEIIRVDNQDVKSWMGIIFRLLAHAGNQDHVLVTVKDSKQLERTYAVDLFTWHMNKLTPDPLSSLGILPYQPPMPLNIGFIKPDSPAAKSGLKLGDHINAINHVAMKNWEQVLNSIQLHPAQTVIFSIQRQQQHLDIPVNVDYQRSLLFKKLGYLGIAPHIEIPKEMINHLQYNPITALTPAWREISDFSYYNLLLLGKLITGKLSLESLGGPITIFESAGDALYYGLLSFLSFLAFLSISIGIINLLPIPGLDGGHLFIQLIELTIRRPVPEYLMVIMYRIGLLLLVFVLVQALVNDVLRMM